MSILTPTVLAIIRESVQAAPELGPEQERYLRRVWAPRAQDEYARRTHGPAGAVTTRTTPRKG